MCAGLCARSGHGFCALRAPKLWKNTLAQHLVAAVFNTKQKSGQELCCCVFEHFWCISLRASLVAASRQRSKLRAFFAHCRVPAPTDVRCVGVGPCVFGQLFSETFSHSGKPLPPGPGSIAGPLQVCLPSLDFGMLSDVPPFRQGPPSAAPSQGYGHLSSSGPLRYFFTTPWGLFSQTVMVNFIALCTSWAERGRLRRPVCLGAFARWSSSLCPCPLSDLF